MGHVSAFRECLRISCKMTFYICCFCAPRLKDVIYSNWNRKQCEEMGIIRLLSKSASNDLKNLDKPRTTFQYLHFKRGPERVSQKSTCDRKISGKQSPKCIEPSGNKSLCNVLWRATEEPFKYFFYLYQWFATTHEIFYSKVFLLLFFC